MLAKDVSMLSNTDVRTDGLDYTRKIYDISELGFDIESGSEENGLCIINESFKDTEFMSLDFSSKSLVHCNFDHCKFNNCTFDGITNLIGAHMVNSEFYLCDMRGLTTKRSKLNHVKFEGCDMANGLILESDVKQSLFVNCDLHNMDVTAGISGSSLEGTKFKHSVLDSIRFKNVDLEQARFGNSEPIVMNVYGVATGYSIGLNHAIFRECNMDNTTFYQVSGDGVSFVANTMSENFIKDSSLQNIHTYMSTDIYQNGKFETCVIDNCTIDVKHGSIGYPGAINQFELKDAITYDVDLTVESHVGCYIKDSEITGGKIDVAVDNIRLFHSTAFNNCNILNFDELNLHNGMVNCVFKHDTTPISMESANAAADALVSNIEGDDESDRNYTD